MLVQVSSQQILTEIHGFRLGLRSCSGHASHETIFAENTVWCVLSRFMASQYPETHLISNSFQVKNFQGSKLWWQILSCSHGTWTNKLSLNTKSPSNRGDCRDSTTAPGWLQRHNDFSSVQYPARATHELLVQFLGPHAAVQLLGIMECRRGRLHSKNILILASSSSLRDEVHGAKIKYLQYDKFLLHCHSWEHNL